jgi:hypothetical protein
LNPVDFNTHVWPVNAWGHSIPTSNGEIRSEHMRRWSGEPQRRDHIRVVIKD